MGTNDRKDTRKDTAKAGRTQDRPASSRSAGKPEAAEGKAAKKADTAAERFVKDVEVRGEAAKPTPEGKLPLDATHVVVEENPDGTAKKIERARFKAF